MGDGDDLRGSLERLVALGQTPDVNIRPVLLRVLVDLFVRKAHHAPNDLAQFEEITQHLLDEADPETRLIVAEKLSRHPSMPKALADRFLAERGPMAGHVLEHSDVGADTLAAAAAWGSVEMAVAVARRSDLGLALCRSLAERPEPEVLLALVGNPGAPLDRGLVQYLVRRARGDDALSYLLLEREGAPADVAPLFLLANSEQRSAIVLAARRDELGPDNWRPRLSAQEVAALSRVERSLFGSDQDSFDVALAAALGVDIEIAWRLMDDSQGEPLALALAAIGASPEFAARVFILSGPAIGRSVMAVRHLTGLVESMPMRVARRLVSTMTNEPVKPRRSHAAGVQDGGKPRRQAGPEARPQTSADLAPLQRRLMGARFR